MIPNFKLRLIICLSALLILSACGSHFDTFPVQTVSPGAISQSPNEPTPDPTTTFTNLKFCSPLSFSGVRWAPDMDLKTQRAFAIGLSLTGGFEGSAGWQNLTNNFDGMGMSGGLLNQTLGTESLQPLLQKIIADHRSEVSTVLTPEHLTGIIGMLNSWHPSLQLKELKLTEVQEDSPFVFQSGLQEMRAKNSSVQWAVDHLYQSNGQFLPDWRQQLKSLFSTTDYINLQIEAALRIHLKAMAYMKRTGFKDLRSYLLFFDIIVQNGSISDTRFQEWKDKVVHDRIVGEVALLKALIEIRLQDTLEEYRADVRSRKYAVVDGEGVVHGKNWNLSKSYCYDSADPVE